jgi:hypothetical protein
MISTLEQNYVNFTMRHTWADPSLPVIVRIVDKCKSAHHAFIGLLLESHAVGFQLFTSSIEVVHKEPCVSKTSQLTFVFIVAVVIPAQQAVNWKFINLISEF